MCGRFTLKTQPSQWGQLLLPLVQEYGSRHPDWESSWSPRYNIAPTQDVMAVYDTESDGHCLDYFRWGLIPSWAQELAIGNRMINARSETVQEKRSFSKALEKRRCLVLADGYYEWQRVKGGAKQACWIAPKHGGIILMAGLWETNRRIKPEGVRSCTIITAAANAALTHIHDRMPAILDGSAIEQWMDDKTTKEQAQSLLGSIDDDYLEVRPVSPYVNNPRNQGPACLEVTAD